MLTRTHLAIGFFAALFLVDKVPNGFLFVIATVIASVIPDIDSAFSSAGKHIIFRPIQFFTKHRGMLHSFTFCLVFSLLFAFYIPVLALPFFLGYGLHLIADSFTREGIRFFWPWNHISAGPIRVGSTVEDMLFLVVCLLDLGLVVLRIL